jgi:hypothetical protein
MSCPANDTERGGGGGGGGFGFATCRAIMHFYVPESKSGYFSVFKY